MWQHVLDQQMRHELLTMKVSVAERVLRTVGVCVLLLILLRLTGKRGLAGMNSFD
jgi:hypothetical protein